MPFPLSDRCVSIGGDYTQDRQGQAKTILGLGGWLSERRAANNANKTNGHALYFESAGLSDLAGAAGLSAEAAGAAGFSPWADFLYESLR